MTHKKNFGYTTEGKKRAYNYKKALEKDNTITIVWLVLNSTGWVVNWIKKEP